MWVNKGLAFIGSKGVVFISTCPLLTGSELRWKEGDVMGGCSEHPDTGSEGPGECELRLCAVARMTWPL